MNILPSKHREMAELILEEKQRNLFRPGVPIVTIEMLCVLGSRVKVGENKITKHRDTTPLTLHPILIASEFGTMSLGC